MELKPHSRARVSFLTVARSSRKEVLDILGRHQSSADIIRSMDLARARSERELIELGMDSDALEQMEVLLSALLYPSTSLRAQAEILAQNEKGQSGLWAFGISGDYPILLVRVQNGESSLLLEALQAYAYWRNRHIPINLVILNEQDTGYALDLHNGLMRQIVRMGLQSAVNTREGIFLLRRDQISQADRVLLETVAGVVLDENNGTLAEHARRLERHATRLPGINPGLPAKDPEPTEPLNPSKGLPAQPAPGQFSQDGKEYIIRLQPGEHTPHPWINVVANPDFGFLVSEAGGGCTWAVNSGENRLTPWRNDPVTDMPGEALYLRDEETGLSWSPSPMPCGAKTVHEIRHGAGYSTIESQSHGLNQKLKLFAATDSPVKIVHVRLENLWTRPRRITLTYYAEWVLGTARDVTQAFIIPEFEPETGALLASNRYNAEFNERVAFLASSKKPHGVTADRTEFVGRLGSMRYPAALGRIGLAGAVQPGQDPCAALQVHVDLAEGQSEELYFLLGEGKDRNESLEIIRRYQAAEKVEAAWQAVQEQWDAILGTITVRTPDPEMDLILNRWLLYQALSCRLWGRTALYQSSGAFGFRDQLQDVMALLHSRPDLAREHILCTAAHQFEEGDVLHWWNPPSGRGVRTRFSDDLLWLPFVTAEYVNTTGDTSILEEQIPFMHGEPLKPDEDERYAEFELTSQAYTLFEHCRRAIERGNTAGPHGLPLMGTGDWNDGMNRVGIQGRGESIWLGWFLYAVLKRFSGLSTLMKEDPSRYEAAAESLAGALDKHAWDGAWYLRAYYDDGSPLGSNRNNECKIDSIAQSWGVLSEAARPERAKQGMEAVDKFLVRRPEQLVLLFTPPFDKTPRDPGYIKGYPPGVRENGGQYTHAAIWSAWAFAKLGRGERAYELFSLLNPVHHADAKDKADRYKVEPYVIAADIYSVSPHVGRGGWTWYTGSAAWMYRLGMEAILGIQRSGEVLKIDPCIPTSWPGFTVDYKYSNAVYHISVENPRQINRGVKEIVLDGKAVPEKSIQLQGEGQHDVKVILG
jgi:cyclic beta-1,2-glucan synthetase